MLSPRRLLALAAIGWLALAACGPSASAPAAPGASRPGAATQPSTPSTPAEKLEALNRLPPDERQARLVAEAKREGTVVWYGTVISLEIEPFIAAFNELYPDVKVEYNRRNGAEMLDTLTSEYRAGRYLVDLAMVGPQSFEELKKAGVIGRYCSPEREGVGEQFKDRNCEWTARHINPRLIGYNTSRVAVDEIPRSWDDLLNPRLRGRVGMPADEGDQFIVSIQNAFGKEQGEAYVRRLAEQRVQLHRSNTGLAQLVAAGDVDVGFYLNVSSVATAQRRGAPIASSAPDPLVTGLTPVVFARQAPHPHAAALLIDYLLSREGQQRMAELNTRFGPRVDVTYPDQQLLEGARLVTPSPEQMEQGASDHQRAARLFKELFGQR